VTFGITGFGAYIPRLRIERAAIAAANAWMVPGLKAQAKGVRAFCGWDEDAVTMAVEAARDCLAGRRRDQINAAWLASTTLPYSDLSNSSLVAGALGLARTISALDLAGSERAGTSALALALESRTENVLLIASERPRAKPASSQELAFGAGAAALTLGTSDVIAKFLGKARKSAPFVDHVRAADAPYPQYWEERWIREAGYGALVPPVVDAALSSASLAMGDITHLVMPSPLKGASATLAKSLGFTGSVAGGLEDGCGYTGAAHGLLMLADVLGRAKPGEKILLVGFAQGVEAIIFEATGEIETRSAGRGVSGAMSQGQTTDSYMRFLSFYGEVQPEWGMRSEKSERASLSAHYRVAEQLAGFFAGACEACGTVQFPRLAYCVNPSCGAPSSQFSDHPLTEEEAQVLTVTTDWLSFTPAPPLHVGFVQFKSGARLLMEMVDVGAASPQPGMPLRLVFRIKERDKVRGFNRYFWKAAPATITREH